MAKVDVAFDESKGYLQFWRTEDGAAWWQTKEALKSLPEPTRSVRIRRTAAALRASG